MRGHQQRARIRFQELLQPDDRFDIQVVGRLVHQQHVGPAEQHARQRHAHLPAARERAHVAIDLVVLEAQPVQHLARLRFERVAAQVLVLLLHLAEALQDAVHLVRRCSGSSMACCRASSSWCRSPSAAAAGDGFVQHRAALHLLHVLAEVADGAASWEPRPRLRRATSSPTIMRKSVVLPEPFGPDQPDLLAGVQLKGGVDEDQLLAVLLVDVGKGNHASLR